MSNAKRCRRWIVAALLLTIVSAETRLTAQGAGATLRVRITDSAFRAIPLANLLILGKSGAYPSGTDGRVPAIQLSAGQYRLVARAIGFVPDTISVVLKDGEARSLDAKLVRVIYRLRDLVTTAPSWAPSLEDYARRVQVYGGRLITRRDIERSSYLHVADLLGTVIGMRIDHVPPTVNLQHGRIDGGATYIHSTGCIGRGSMFIDGREIMGSPAPLSEVADRLEVVRPLEIELVEVYRRREEIPARYRDPEACMAVMIWTTAFVRSAAPQQPAPIVFTHVSLIDGTDSLPRRDYTVVVQGSRISAVGPASAIAIPGGARVIDGRGKFLIPGLWDMHVHTDAPAARQVLPLYIANGVTGVRDMAGDWSHLTGFRTDIAAGLLIGPRIVASGPYLDGNDQPIPHYLARSPAEAVAAVDSLAALGVDFIKLHTGLNRETFLAAAAEARARHLPFAGHVPRVVGAADASDAGMASIEHLLTIPTPCTPAESLALAPRYVVQGALGRCSSEDPAPLYERLARNHTAVTPTFTAQYEVALWPRRTLPGDSLARYLPDTLRRFTAAIFPMPDDVPAGADSVGLAVFAKRLALVGALHRAGVIILPGTDAPLRNSPPGFGLHFELAWLVEAGLSPWRALVAATLEPAKFMGLQDSLGTIAAGKLADLVLLDADPLADIRNTRRIRAVIANGRLLDPAALKKPLH